MSDLPRRIGLLAPAAGGRSALPLVLEDFWLQLGLFVMAAVVGAVGLTLLVGVAGPAVPRPCRVRGHRRLRLRLGDVGVHAHARRCRPARGRSGSCSPSAVAALVGVVFSPVASRLRGIYLGLATLGPGLPRPAPAAQPRGLDRRVQRPRGGAVHRSAGSASATATPTTSPSPAWSSRACTGSGTCSSSSPCWPAGWPPTCAASRTGRAWANVRDSETAAAAMGIAVARHKAIGVRRLLRLRRARRGAARAGLRPARPRRLQPHPVGRLPGDDRAGRARLGRRRHGRRAVRHRAAARAGAVQRLAAVPGRPRLRRAGPRDGVPAALRRWPSSPSSSSCAAASPAPSAGCARRRRPSRRLRRPRRHRTPPPTDPGHPAGAPPSRSKETAR